jgi:hypothetical protein
MPIGPGKYDDLCTHVRTTAGALGAIVIVVGGKHGDGFSIQAPIEVTIALPEFLEFMARSIRADLERGGTH